LNLSIWEKTLAICGNRKYAVRAGVIAALVAGLYLADVCLHAGGVIPLSTRIPVQELEQDFPAGQAQEQAQPVPDLDQELVDLLHRSSVAGDSVAPQWKIVRMRVTAYCTCPKCCGKFADGRTADMHKIHHGDTFVAADKRIPFGTEIIIPGYNEDRPVVVKDRGRLIKGNRLDVFFNNHQTAKKWGAKYLDVMVKVED
jgi:3D (Asp-Asp-Asp) domain-containing protein